MNNNELDELVESFLQPKQSETIGLKELFALFEQQDSTYMAGFLPTSKVKKYEQEPEAISTFYDLNKKFFEAVRLPEYKENPITKIETLIVTLNKLKTNPSSLNFGLSNSIIISNYVSSLHKMILDITPGLESAAGFLFEKFVSLLFGVEPSNLLGEKSSICDVNMTGGKCLSVKLYSKNQIDGSIMEMIKFFVGPDKYNSLPKDPYFRNKFINHANRSYILLENEQDIEKIINLSGDKTVTYLVALKKEKGAKINFYSYEFNAQMFFNMLTGKDIENYTFYLKNAVDKPKEKLQSTIKQMNTIKAQINFMEAQSEETDEQYEKIDNLKTQLQDLEAEAKKLEQILLGQTTELSSNVLKFRFSSELLSQRTLMDMDGIELELTAEDRNKIISSTLEPKKADIKKIVNEANLIYYKINNYLMVYDNDKVEDNKKDELARDAYDSAQTLEHEIGSLSGLKFPSTVDNNIK